MRLLNHAANKLFIRKFLQSSALILLEFWKINIVIKGLTFILSKFCVMLSPAGVTCHFRCYNVKSINVTFNANLMTPNTVSLRSHNLRTTTNLWSFGQSRRRLCGIVSACSVVCSFVICCLHDCC